MNDLNISEISLFIKDSFIFEKAAGIDFSVQLELTGSENEYWYLLVQNQTCKIEQGSIPNSNAQVILEKENLIHLIKGELNPSMAFFTGKIKISGDQSGLFRIVSLFNINKEKRDLILAKYKY